MNEEVQRFRDLHRIPSDEVFPVSILGHSLGALIGYDLVMAQEGASHNDCHGTSHKETWF